MKNLYKIIIFTFFTFFANNVFAMSVVLDSNKQSVSIGEEFFVDIQINVEDQSINGTEGSIVYDNTKLEFVRSLNSQSLVTHWVVEPKNSVNGVIDFAGILPNGFGGFLNKQGDAPNLGVITRIIFRPISGGNSVVGVRNLSTTLNDGEGTVLKLTDVGVSIQINNTVNPSTYNVVDINSPILNAEIVKDVNLYNGNATLVFNAIDKDSGIEGVYIKNKKEWVKIINPYDLSNDKSNILLTVKAVDYSGNYTLERFLLPGYGIISYLSIFVFLIGIGFVFLFVYLYRKYVKNKKYL